MRIEESVPSLHALANPARFLKIARPLTPVLFWAGVVLLAYGVWGGLTQTPADYLQGETVRILYIHVPTAWLGMSGVERDCGILAGLPHLAAPAGDDRGACDRFAGRGVRGAVSRDRLDLGPADLGHVVAMGTDG